MATGVQVKKNIWPAIRANLRLAQKSYAAVGFPGNAPKSNMVHGDSGMSNLQVAIANEFGSGPGVQPVVPARPFIKETVKRASRGKVKDLGNELLRMVSKGEMSTKIALDRWGKAGADEMQATIVDSKSWAVPNSDYTKAKKGSDTPLIDQGALLGAVSFRTRMRGSSRVKSAGRAV